ncbi:MAG TPA: zf-HC2 domain-containing protein, partial [Polyangiaceae bacterium]
AFPALSCRQVQRAVDALADGELSAESTLATRDHLAHCPACRRHARWQQALHDGTRHAVHDGGSVAPGFESRVRSALEHERLEEASERVHRAHRSAPRSGWLWGLVVVVPLGVLALLVAREPAAPHALLAAAPEPGPPITTLATIDGVVDQMLGHHAATIPILTHNEPFRDLEREVGFPVSAPPELARHGATWLAASHVSLGGERAAALSYRVSGHRCTLFLYDDARLPVRRSSYLSAHAVDQRPVFVGKRRGYALAAVERRGLGYALATDLDVTTAARLAAAIR